MTPLDVNAANNGLHLEPLFWQVQLEYSGAKEDRVGIGSSQTHRATEKILLRQTGYWVDPKLFDFSIGLTPTFFQEQFSGELQDFHSSGGSFDYDISFGLLRGAKNLFDVGTQASRVTGSYSSDLGNYIDYMSEDLSVTLGVKLAPFPMTLTYSEHILDQETNSGSGASSRYREEIQQSLRWRAHSSKLDVLVDRRWFDDRIGEND